ncbi:helix-turn-helix domain-containing protein [Alistipes muris]|uniref:helix-turn-helix domain-containing protein n=1 Tax=Alistipes TaxID=239759 RepID=UPI00203CB5D5|nr:helix-turn-helix domain-containing protein [Alistipes muris]MCX4282012.1 helix-turn-helix domain-containing protein [Alistipes sp.]
MNENRDEQINRILNIVMEILEDVRTLRTRQNVLMGDPMLEFPEVCEMLKQSERQVRRLRESGELVGFTIGRRRMYLQSEVDDFIQRSRKQNKHNK